jgi:Putative esterase
MAGPGAETVDSRARLGRAAVAAGLLGVFLAVGAVGVYRYARGFWLYRGFPPPNDPAFVSAKGSAERIYVASAALGGRSQPVDVYLPPGYSASTRRRYPVFYLLHGFPGRPGAFLQTVRMGVVEDVLVARHRIRPVILVMPFGSTGSFTDKEWVDGVRPHEGWATFVSRDLVRAVDSRFRTIPTGPPGDRGPVRGRLRGDRHRPPSPARVPCGRELVWIRAGGPDPVDLRARPRAARGEQPAAPDRPRGPCASGRSDAVLVLLRIGRPPARSEPPIRGRPAAAPPSVPIPRPARRAQLGALARQCRRWVARRREAPRMTALVRVGSTTAALLAALAVLVAATGWLYLLRPVGDFRPRIGDALPLDELARHASSSLVLFAAVWLAAGLLLG